MGRNEPSSTITILGIDKAIVGIQGQYWCSLFKQGDKYERVKKKCYRNDKRLGKYHYSAKLKKIGLLILK